ncbi:MAG: hypothetical protein M1339_01440 [Bacteroidetes bacterium]|nr:hypothetical protein [Bacteroidota bacterium]
MIGTVPTLTVVGRVLNIYGSFITSDAILVIKCEVLTARPIYGAGGVITT